MKTVTFNSLARDLSLTNGATGLVCVVRPVPNGARVRVRVIVLRNVVVAHEFSARFSLTMWRGLMLPALRHYAAFNAIPFDVQVIATTPTSRAPALTGD